MKTLLIAVLSCLLLASCGGNSETTAAAAKGGAPAGPRGGGGRGNAAAPRKVDTVPVIEKSLDEVAQVTGTLAAEQDIVLGMKVAGRIAEITVDLGSPVRKVETIARIDPTDFELRVRASAAAASDRDSLSLRKCPISMAMKSEQISGLTRSP